MILKSEISPKTFEILKKVKSRTGFFGVADPLVLANSMNFRTKARKAQQTHRIKCNLVCSEGNHSRLSLLNFSLKLKAIPE